jgi:hypothetical protein
LEAVLGLEQSWLLFAAVLRKEAFVHIDIPLRLPVFSFVISALSPLAAWYWNACS